MFLLCREVIKFGFYNCSLLIISVKRHSVTSEKLQYIPRSHCTVYKVFTLPKFIFFKCKNMKYLQGIHFCVNFHDKLIFFPFLKIFTSKNILLIHMIVVKSIVQYKCRCEFFFTTHTYILLVSCHEKAHFLHI